MSCTFDFGYSSNPSNLFADVECSSFRLYQTPFKFITFEQSASTGVYVQNISYADKMFQFD